MRTLFSFVALFILLLPVKAGNRPNIIVILTDDMGYSDLGCFGGEISTPNLDQLGYEGLRLTDFYNTSRCWPTRATLLTGRYSESLSDRQATIPELLKQQGYQTGMVGKWHLSGPKNPDNSPMNRGFDDFYGTINGAGSFWDPPTLTRGHKQVEPEGKNFYYTDKIGTEAVRQIEELSRKKKPFFQYVSFTAAHWPLHAPERTIRKYKDYYTAGWEVLKQHRYERMLNMGVISQKEWPFPPLNKKVNKWVKTGHKEWEAHNMAVYAAMVEHMDRAVGKIVNALKKNKCFENTLIIYLHDNGACAEHLYTDAFKTARNVMEKAKKQGRSIAVGDRYDVQMGGPDTYGSIGRHWAHAQNTPLRYHKKNVHEGGICTPAIFHWPEGLKSAGTICRKRGHVVDILATCLELAGGSYPQKYKENSLLPMEGRSLVPVLQGSEWNREHCYYFSHKKTDAIIKGDYKLVRNEKSPWELYKLSEDRTETKDLAAAMPAKVKLLEKLWLEKYKPRSQ